LRLPLRPKTEAALRELDPGEGIPASHGDRRGRAAVGKGQV